MNEKILHWRQKIGVWWIPALWMPFFIFLIWWGGDFFFRLPAALATGDYFRMVSDILAGEPFNTIHAGGALDQPTIGKFLLLFTLFSAIAIPLSLLIRRVTDMRKKLYYWTYAVVFCFVMLLAVSLLMIPAIWLTHYIYDMGMTTRRIQGVCFAIGGVLVWAGTGIAVLSKKRPFNPPEKRMSDA
jgi:hypothetical protein